MEATPQELIDIANRDLVRISRKHNISVSPKSANTHLVIWRQDMRLNNYTVFKHDYMYAEDCLRRWMDTQIWMQGIDFSMRWLSIRLSPENSPLKVLLQWRVCEPYENFGT